MEESDDTYTCVRVVETSCLRSGNGRMRLEWEMYAPKGAPPDKTPRLGGGALSLAFGGVSVFG